MGNFTDVSEILYVSVNTRSPKLRYYGLHVHGPMALKLHKITNFVSTLRSVRKDYVGYLALANYSTVGYSGVILCMA